jgi:folate-binding protein YgfZ
VRSETAVYGPLPPDETGVMELDWRAVIRVAGEDRVRFIHGMCTNDVKALSPGQGCMAAVVNRQGKMVAEIIVRATQDALLLETDRLNLPTLEQTMRRYVVADKVEISATSLTVIGAYGAAPERVVGAPDLPNFHFMERGGLLYSRNRILGGIDILAPSTAAPKEIERIKAAGAITMMRIAYFTLRIERGFPQWGIDMSPDVLPMEAGLEPIAISYAKGCYVGQEVIQRVKTYSEPPRALVQLVLDDMVLPTEAAVLRAGTEEVGNVTSAALSTTFGSGVALGYVRKEHKRPGTRLVVSEGIKPVTVPVQKRKDIPAVVRTLPWHEWLV